MLKKQRSSKNHSDSNLLEPDQKKIRFFIGFFSIFDYHYAMYIAVIPLSRSLGREPYTYLLNETWENQISVGSLVEIPLGNHIVEGIISHLDCILPDGLDASQIRPIIRVIAEIPL
jgi:hypothetical protein